MFVIANCVIEFVNFTVMYLEWRHLDEFSVLRKHAMVSDYSVLFYVWVSGCKECANTS